MRINSSLINTTDFVNDQYMSGADFKTELEMRIQGTQDALTLGYTGAITNVVNNNALITQNITSTISSIKNGVPSTKLGAYSWGGKEDASLKKYWPSISKFAISGGMDPFLIAGVIQIESSWDPNCRSSADARGLMQLWYSKDAAKDYPGLNKWFDGSPIENQNIKYGCRELKQKIDHFQGNVDAGLYAYNGGIGRVDPQTGLPYSNAKIETKQYAQKVSLWWNWLKANYKITANSVSINLAMPLAPVTVPKM